MEAKTKEAAEPPLRLCVGCRSRLPQDKLVRFVREPGLWRGEPLGARRGPGRGAYLCSRECVARVAKNKRYPGLASAAAEYVFNGG